MSQSPILALRAEKSAGEIFPAISALRPYSTPTLSAGRSAKPSDGRRPKTLTMESCSEQRTRGGFVFGSYTWSAGTPGQLRLGSPLDGIAVVKLTAFAGSG